MDNRGGTNAAGSAAAVLVLVAVAPAEGDIGGSGGDDWFSKRERRWVDARGGIMSGDVVPAVVGGDAVEVGSPPVGGLRMLENHFWTADAGETSVA